MRKKNRYFLFLISLNLLFSFFSFNAYALTCYLGSDTSATIDKDTLKPAAYLNEKNNGERIWTSQEFSRTITCRSYLTDGGSENVYIYPYPNRKTQNFPRGVLLGLIVNGKDMGTFSPTGSVEESRIDTGWKVKNTASSNNMVFQIYMVKNGQIVTTDIDEITVFQLDGAGGINAIEGANYSIMVSGWENLNSVDCSSSGGYTAVRLNNIKTRDILNKSFSYDGDNNLTDINFSCAGKTDKAVEPIKSVKAKITYTGTPSPEDNNYFATNKEALGLKIETNGETIFNGKTFDIEVSLTGGIGAYSPPLKLTPHIFNPDINHPEWLFSEDNTTISNAIYRTIKIEDIINK